MTLGDAHAQYHPHDLQQLVGSQDWSPGKSVVVGTISVEVVGGHPPLLFPSAP